MFVNIFHRKGEGKKFQNEECLAADSVCDPESGGGKRLWLRYTFHPNEEKRTSPNGFEYSFRNSKLQ